MSDDTSPQHNWGGSFSRRRFLQGAAGGVAGIAGAQFLGGAQPAEAAVQCPNANPIVHENRCTPQGSWSPNFKLGAGKYDATVTGFATRTTYDVGDTVEVKLNTYDPMDTTSCILQVYRLGYYGGAGGRLVRTVAVPTLTQQPFLPALDTLGYTSARTAWSVSASIPTAGLVSGMYLVKIVTNMDGENHIPFVLRDDDRSRDLLVAMPTNTWLAYNNWAGKSLYNYNSDDPLVTVTGADANGRSRAAKVSFDRPMTNVFSDYNWVLRTEYPLIFWLERMGYDLAYTDDVGLHSQAAQLKPPKTKTLVLAGHSEYWTREAYENVKAARNAGANVASFSANTAYWQVRYEEQAEGFRAMSCFKTVQGNGITTQDGNAANDGQQTLGCNDFGPGAVAPNRSGPATNRPNDPLGDDQVAPTADDRPQFATTTFRDGGSGPAPGGNGPNDAAVRGVGRPVVAKSENELFGCLYIGDDDAVSYPLKVPAGSGAGGEFGAHPAWRHTSVAAKTGASIGSNLVGWEWDAIPKGGPGQPNFPYVARQPGGVKRLTQTDMVASSAGVAGAEVEFLKDEGHTYGPTPPAGQGSEVHSVTYKTASGALVFAAGTIQWSWGLGPHFLATFADNYEKPPIDTPDARIQQATYNIFVDGGVKPSTPEGVTMDTAPKPAPKPPPPAKPVPAPKDTTPPSLAMPRRPRRLQRDGAVSLSLKAPSSEKSSVEGSITLFALVRRPGSRRRRRVRLGTGFVKVPAGRSATAKVRMSRRHRRALAKQGAWRVQAVAKVRDQAGNSARLTSTFRLLARRRRRRRRSPS